MADLHAAARRPAAPISSSTQLITRSADRPSVNWHWSSTTCCARPHRATAPPGSAPPSHHLGRRPRHANGAARRDVHVVRERVVAPRRRHVGSRLRTIEADVDDRRVEDARLDGDRRGDVDDDVGVAQRVAKVALMLGHHVDRQAVGHRHGVAERLFDDHVRRARELAVGVDLVARMQPHQHLRARQRAARESRSRARAARDRDGDTAIAASSSARSACATGRRRCGGRTRRAASAARKCGSNCGAPATRIASATVAVQFDRLRLHDVVPHHEPIDLPHRDQLVGEVVPARIDRHATTPRRRAVRSSGTSENTSPGLAATTSPGRCSSKSLSICGCETRRSDSA